MGSSHIPDEAEGGQNEYEVLLAAREQLERNPTAIELACDPADLEMIRKLFGSRAQTIINCLLAFDAYFDWYYALTNDRIPLFCEMSLREERALDNMTLAINMHEIFERVTIRKHCSYLPHGAIYKVTRDILTVGDVMAFSLSALELQNAETKRVASTGGSRRLTMSATGMKRAPLKQGGIAGPASLVRTKGYSSSQAISVLNNLLTAQKLRLGDGIQTRRAERLMSDGRVTLSSSGCNIEKLGADYDPRQETCVKAFVRLLSTRAIQE